MTEPELTTACKGIGPGDVVRLRYKSMMSTRTLYGIFNRSDRECVVVKDMETGRLREMPVRRITSITKAACVI